MEQQPDSIPLSEIEAIISKRKRSGLAGIVIVTGLLIWLVVAAETGTKVAFMIAGLAVIAPLALLYIVNSMNATQLRPSYRVWNKVVYIYLAKIVMILSLIRAFSSVTKAANPLDGFMKSGGPGKGELLFDAAVSAGVSYNMYKSLPAARKVELYFGQQLALRASTGQAEVLHSK